VSAWSAGAIVVMGFVGCEAPETGKCQEGYVRDDAGRCAGVAAAADDSGEPEVPPPVDTGGSEPDSRFAVGERIACDAPLTSVTYTDVAAEWGLTSPAVVPTEHSENGAVAVADFDLDGDLDVVLGFLGEPAVMYTREGDGFEKSHLPGQDGITQLGMADVDSDGRLDLLTGGFEPQVLLNLSTGWTVIDFPISPMADETSVTKSIHPMDIDRDGHQDAYVLMSALETSGDAGMDTIAWGAGDGTFTLDTGVVPSLWGHQKGFDVQWFDWDADGWQDVYVVNELSLPGAKSTDRNEANFFLRNNNGALELANDECGCSLQHDGMGAALGDYNNDGRPDLYLTATGKNVLLAQLEDQTYVDVGQSTGADTLDGTIASMAWGSVMVDIDNDGLLDVAVAEGDLWHEFTEDAIVADMPFNVRRQVEAGRYENANAMGFGQMGSWRTVVPADHNGDGILDFVVGEVEQRPLLLLSDGCTANNWLQVAAPHGSRVEIDVGEQTRTAWANTASSFGGVAEPVAHFGLGAATEVREIRVQLPDGESLLLADTVQARRRITVH